MKNEFSINGYDLHNRNLNKITERSVLIYTKVGLVVTRIELSEDLKECIFIKI